MQQVTEDRTLEREAMVRSQLAEFAYQDSPLPIEEGQTISQPYIVALMVEALGLRSAGTAYSRSALDRVTPPPSSRRSPIACTPSNATAR